MQKNIFKTKDLGLLIRKARKKQWINKSYLTCISRIGKRFIV
ncbi:hypothetical protein [Francisella tularensis]|nr:hypothetical protein [Francisella tularensis]